MMIGSFMQFFSLYDLYSQWESAGIFNFLLPALLIFSVIFGILTSTDFLGSNKGVKSIIAATAALMAMRLQIVSDFFSLLLPGLGIGIAVLIVVLILAGLFMYEGNRYDWVPTFFWGGLVVGLIVVISTLNSLAWFGSVWWQVNWVSVLWMVIIILVLLPFFREGKDAKARQAENLLFGHKLVPDK